MHSEPWYGRECLDRDGFGLCLLHHGQRDSNGRLVWQQGERTVVVHGAISNRNELEETTDELFESLFSDPTSTLSRFNGPFVISGIDTSTDEIILATDKLGTRPCYYNSDNDFTFASNLSPLLSRIDEPKLNQQAVCDMLLMGYVWGEKTLIDGISSLPPATVLEYSEGELTTEQYWSCSFDSLPHDGYISGLIGKYRETIDEISETIDNNAGLWLSGGLDSRTMAAELKRYTGESYDTLTAYTYDANPHGGGNPELAAEVASLLDIGLEQVELTPEIFLNRIKDGVDLTNGMLRWSSFLNLLSIYALSSRPPDVLLEGAGQGELMGHHLRRDHLTDTDSAVESMYWSEAMIDHRDAAALLSEEVDPLQSFIDAAETSDEHTFKGTVLDAHFNNYYSRMTFASNEIPRSQTGTRVPFAHGDFLEYVARLPLKYRMRTLPFSGGKIPYGVTQTKLELTRSLGSSLADVRYERTGVAPKHPFPLHVAGFITGTGLARLRQRTTYGGRSVPDQWYRNNPDVRAFFDDLIDGACERSVFDADEIRRLRREHLSGEANHMVTSLAAVTTLELWMRRHLD